MEDFKNCFPILESFPMARDTSLIDAPTFSHNALIEFILEIRCAKNAFAVYRYVLMQTNMFTNFAISDDQRLIVKIRS